MELKINIDEQKILELAKTASIEELPRTIFYEAKRQAVELAVNEIKSKLVEKSFYNGKESLFNEVKDYLYKQIEDIIKQHIEAKFSEKNIELMVNRYFERTIEIWIEKKIYERLNEIKADINFYSQKQLDNERGELDEKNNEPIL